MKALDELNKYRQDIQKLQERRQELVTAKRIISGGTQKKFTLHAGDIKVDLCGDMDRGYTYNMKPCYDMVKLGLTKGLDKQIDEVDERIADLSILASNECQAIIDSS